MKNQNNNLTTFLSQVSIFDGMDKHDLERISHDLVKRRFRKGETVFQEGDPGQFLYIIHSGQVRIFVNGPDGQEISVVLYGHPGQMFGHLSLIDGHPRLATAVSLCATTLYTLNRTNFQRYIQQYCPQLALNLLYILCDSIRNDNKQKTALASQGIPQRLAYTLIQLAEDHGQPKASGIQIDLSLTQGDLASFIGATRESVNKSLRAWHSQKWIRVQSRRITILDAEALHRHGAMA